MQSLFYDKAAKNVSCGVKDYDSDLEEGYEKLDLNAESTVNTKGGLAAVNHVVESRMKQKRYRINNLRP